MTNRTLSLYEFFKRFPDEQTSRQFFENKRWNGQPTCPHCQSQQIKESQNHKMTHYCRTCKKYFSVRIGTILESSRLPLQKWLLCLYLMITHRKGLSSIQVSKILGVTQKTSWFLCHRIREVWSSDSNDKLFGVVEVDETFFGGKEENKHYSKKLNKGRGSVGKLTILGCVQRGGRVSFKLVKNRNSDTLKGFIRDHVSKGSTVYTDTFKSYHGLTGFNHEMINHYRKQYVRGKVYTNTIESLWSLLKRGYHGVYHYLSSKHLGRYLQESSFRHNTSKQGTMDTITETISRMIGKRLTYQSLVGRTV